MTFVPERGHRRCRVPQRASTLDGAGGYGLIRSLHFARGNLMAERKLTTVFRPLGHTQPLLDGTVKPKTFTIDYVSVEPLIAAFRRMVRGSEFDICELAITTYITAKSYGKKFTAIPIFPARAFHHGAILVNRNAGIKSAKDLEGKR